MPYSQRYVIRSDQRVDKWTGKVDKLDYGQYNSRVDEKNQIK